ncbi:MAG: YkgJ family cysteine cluster protein [Deltaproteobacteria bacterium]|nr:YkgJ family cysteine cluster protein [Deltaproteobacteria bacterium]MCW5807482.1 YkgJ family cysteine cluster protein [Deltaproteobacteria bacterium]
MTDDARDAPISRRDFERAVRALNLSDLSLRDAVLQLSAQVVTLTDELTRRLDKVEPQPAPAGTPPTETPGTLEEAVTELIPTTLAKIRAADARSTRVALDMGADKYEVTPADVPCAELIPLCGARCCTYTFALSTADLDEGVIRWDYGQPYLIRQRASDGFCVHNDPTTRGCTAHAHRPRVCRTYDCRDDKRVWTDYERRIPAPLGQHFDETKVTDFDLFERARLRSLTVHREAQAIATTFSDGAPRLPPQS